MRLWVCLMDALDAPGEVELGWLTEARTLLGAEGGLLVPFGPAQSGHIHRYRRCEALAARVPWLEVDRTIAAQRREPRTPKAVQQLADARGVKLMLVVPPGQFRRFAGALRACGGVIFTAPGEHTAGIRRFMQAAPSTVILIEDAPTVPSPPPLPPPATARLSFAEIEAVWEEIGLPTIPRGSLSPDVERGQRLGRGNAAWVSGKVHPDLGSVAVKTHPIGGEVSKEGSFLREAAALKRLAGAPGVVRCFGGYVEDGRGALVLERGEGTLQGADPAQLAAVARGLAAMHDAGLTHRDVHAQNVLLVDGNARLMDLGIAWPSPWDAGPPPIGASQQQAPEAIVDARSFVPASDVFSFGTMLYGLLTGRSMWSERPLPARIDAIAAGELPPIPSGPLGEMVAACWRRWPEERPSATALADMLESMPGSAH